jgi:hypothetical protein
MVIKPSGVDSEALEAILLMLQLENRLRKS